MRIGEGQQEEEDRVCRMIFADNSFLFASSEEEIRKMIADTTEELRKRGLDWKEDQMELMGGCCEGKLEMFLWELTKESTEVRRLEPFRPWAAMITKEAGSMSAMRFRMMKADGAF